MASLFGQDLEVAFHTPQDGSFRGELVDTRMTGTTTTVVVEFAEDGPDLPAGERATVVFTGRSLKNPLQAAGHVVACHRNDRGAVRYTVRCEGATGASLGPIVCRRGAPRVRPEAEPPVTVRARPVGATAAVEVELRDVSITGLSLFVPPEAEGILASAWKLELTLELAPDQPCSLVGYVRYRRPAGRFVHYGLEFDRAATPNFDAQREAVVAFVMGRLQRRSGDRSAG